MNNKSSSAFLKEDGQETIPKPSNEEDVREDLEDEN